MKKTFINVCLLMILGISVKAMAETDPGTVNLKHQWTFEDGTANDNVGTVNGTIKGDITFSNGDLNTNNGGWVELKPADLAVNTYKELTVGAWFTSLAGANPNYHFLYYFGNTTNGNGDHFTGFGPARGDNASMAFIQAGGDLSGVKGLEYDDGLLHHVVCVINSTNLTYYIDGNLINSSSIGTNTLANVGTQFAYFAKGGWTADANWKGAIHEISMYDKALTAENVKFLYNAYKVPEVPVSKATNLVLPSNPNIQYMGRIDFSNPDKPLFAYPNVTIKAKFEGTSLNLLLKQYNGSDFSNNYFQSIVDGGTPVKFVVTSSQQTYPVAQNLTEGPHTVEIVKVTETYNGECQFLGFQTDTLKSLVKPDALPALKLEFYGNSITCGYGIEGGAQPTSDNSYKAYPAVAARELNAQFHTISYSGIGVVKGFPTFLMGQMYNRTIANTLYSPLPANNTWDFTRYTPDYVIVALGTNDYNLGFGNGTITTTTFNTGYNSMITKIRAVYPNAQIICTNSPMISDVKLGNNINSDVASFNTARDNKVHYFAFTHMQGGGVGGHPGVADGQTNGKELAAYIKTLLISASIGEVNKNKNDLTLFPNPAVNSINIKSALPIIYIEVSDISGKVIMRKDMSGTTDLDISGYSNGIFILKATNTNGEILVQKLVKK